MSNNKQSSSIDWLLDWIEDVDLTPELWEKIKKQAKAMHKEESVDLYVNGMYKGQELYFGEHKIRLDVNSLKDCEKSADQYYNETFGGNNEQ